MTCLGCCGDQPTPPNVDVKARTEKSCNCCNNNRSTCCFPFLRKRHSHHGNCEITALKTDQTRESILAEKNEAEKN